VGLADGTDGTCPDGTTRSLGVALAVSVSDNGASPRVVNTPQLVTVDAGSSASVKFEIEVAPTSCRNGEGPPPKDAGGVNELSALTYTVTASAVGADPGSGEGSSTGELLCKPSRSGLPPPPSVVITSPLDGAVFSASPITVTGQAVDADGVTVNGLTATLSGDLFSAGVPLFPGTNTLTARAFNEAGEATDSIQVTLDVAQSVTILVPPDGTVTDFGTVTVVGSVADPSQPVFVNGEPAVLIGDRFTKHDVDLAVGATTIVASVRRIDGSSDQTSVAVERAATPELAVTIYSPPAGGVVPGGGLVVRGFVSGQQANTVVHGIAAEVSEGVFTVRDVDLPLGTAQVAADAETFDKLQTARDQVAVEVTSGDPALRLEADPVSGDAPLDTALQLLNASAPFPIDRIDFDSDGDGQLDVVASPSSGVVVTLPEPRPYAARGFVTTPEGVEVSAAALVAPHLPSVMLQELAAGNPVDLAADSQRRLYVLDSSAGTVSRYTAEGVLETSFGSAGSGPDQLASPQALDVGPDGRTYVADTGNDRIQVFAADGSFERTISGPGTDPGQLLAPRGVALVGDSLLVSDTGNERVQFFSLEPDFVTSLAPVASPRGLVDGGSNGVLVASPAGGTLVSILSLTIQTPAALFFLPPQGELASPVDVAGADGEFLVADEARSQVVLLTSTLGLRRVIDGLAAPPRAVLHGLRGETPSVYVADGTRVVEIALPIPSPLPTLQGLRDRLTASDVQGALELIHPLRRSVYERIYGVIESRLPAAAAALDDAEVLELRESRATLLIRRTEDVNGEPRVVSYPMKLVRKEDGGWWIFDY
jgi:uncharacterized Zn-binding protein involved in type VI secretion